VSIPLARNYTKAISSQNHAYFASPSLAIIFGSIAGADNANKREDALILLGFNFTAIVQDWGGLKL